jgi:hypothetical protein
MHGRLENVRLHDDINDLCHGPQARFVDRYRWLHIHIKNRQNAVVQRRGEQRRHSRQRYLFVVGAR